MENNRTALLAKINELETTIKTLTEDRPQTDDPIVRSNARMYFDSDYAPYVATDGSLLWFSGLPKMSSSVFLSYDSPLNITTECYGGASVFLAEINAAMVIDLSPNLSIRI